MTNTKGHQGSRNYGSLWESPKGKRIKRERIGGGRGRNRGAGATRILDSNLLAALRRVTMAVSSDPPSHSPPTQTRVKYKGKFRLHPGARLKQESLRLVLGWGHLLHLNLICQKPMENRFRAPHPSLCSLQSVYIVLVSERHLGTCSFAAVWSQG